MNLNSIVNNIRCKKSFLCVGLDPDLNLLPKCLLDYEDPVFEFNKAIIDATSDLCVAYKPNLAFYEKLGPSGWSSLEKTIKYIPDEHFIIADAKRSDIFNSANMYADTFFDYLKCHGVTISPYMGLDSVSPFLRKNKWAILLIATSNPSASAIQNIITNNNIPLYLELVHQVNSWTDQYNTMFVVGATRLSEMKEIRKIASNHFFLVPGVGAQGGSVKDVFNYGHNKNCGLLVNVSRAIIYAGSDTDFKDEIRQVSLSIQQEMELLLKDKKIIF
ncbi:MAG: orotidine-5'-phosphate decarboxylase [Flavobacteriales bacterium]|nr:orotidine-5'-phosphate decarboxylase [Flavobacteriales bacterium]|tara:strand:- start:504 stop:1325 length:822 start_codon:yes stop_codon:yes gene_type:complete